MSVEKSKSAPMTSHVKSNPKVRTCWSLQSGSYPSLGFMLDSLKKLVLCLLKVGVCMGSL